MSKMGGGGAPPGGSDSAGVGRGWHVTNQLWAERRGREREREFFIDSLLVRVQHID